MPASLSEPLDDVQLELLVTLLLVDVVRAASAVHGHDGIRLAVKDADGDLVLGELAMLHLEDVSGVRDDAINELRILPGEPVAEECPLAVSVDVDLVDREAAAEQLDETCSLWSLP